jgi:hypothetical protein
MKCLHTLRLWCNAKTSSTLVLLPAASALVRLYLCINRMSQLQIFESVQVLQTSMPLLHTVLELMTLEVHPSDALAVLKCTDIDRVSVQHLTKSTTLVKPNECR